MLPPLGVFLAVGLTVGLAAQSCDVGGLTVDDLRDPITITNTSTSHDAYAVLTTAMGERDIALAPGEAETIDVLAAPKYEVDVFMPEDAAGATYKESLLTLRDQLVTLSLHPENPSADVGGALIELGVVESALQQMRTSETYQSCSSPIKSGVPSQVTVTWNPSALGNGGIWALSCG